MDGYGEAHGHGDGHDKDVPFARSLSSSSKPDSSSCWRSRRDILGLGGVVSTNVSSTYRKQRYLVDDVLDMGSMKSWVADEEGDEEGGEWVGERWTRSHDQLAVDVGGQLAPISPHPTPNSPPRWVSCY